MPVPELYQPVSAGSPPRSPRPLVAVVGITNAQTCLNLTGRLRALSDAGFCVALVSSPGDLMKSTAAEQGATAISLPIRREIAPVSDLISLARLWMLLLRLRPRLAEFSSPKAGLLGTVAAALSGVPVRVYMLRGLKLETAAGLKLHILLAAERMAAACAHVVLCNSESMRAKALELRVAPAIKLRVLGSGSSNGVNTTRFSPGPSDARERLGLPHTAHVIGFVGRLTRDKGLPDLVDAFDAILAQDSAAHLLLVGWFDAAEDALGADIRARIHRHPRIHCTGFVRETAAYYRAMDLLVLPTWREGFPNVVLEASASGIPVITTATTGARDAVVPEVTGLLIPPGRPVAIVESVLELLRDPERRIRMGTAGRAWICDNFSDERVLSLAVEFYKSLLREQASRGRR